MIARDRLLGAKRDSAVEFPDTSGMIGGLPGNYFGGGLAIAIAAWLTMGVTKNRLQVPSLEYPDVLFFQAAEGWFELGDTPEASKELERVSPSQSSHPDVLHLRWCILNKSGQWDGCLDIGRLLAGRYPEDPRSWIVLAESHYLNGNVKRAYSTASCAALHFPECWQLLYDAACYACLNSRFDDAKRLFHLATQIEGGKPSSTPRRNRKRRSR